MLICCYIFAVAFFNAFPKHSVDGGMVGAQKKCRKMPARKAKIDRSLTLGLSVSARGSINEMQL